MNVEAISTILFVVILTLILYLNKKKVIIQKIFFPFLYLVILKTKLGLKFMDKAAKKCPKLLKILSNTAIGVGFLGMIFISYTLITNVIKLITVPAAASSMGMVLPIPVKGVFYVPFFYWIISIFILATIHEFSHGVIARLYKIKVKSSGFGFFSILLPAIPLAFVEPDEKQLAKAKLHKKLAVFAAGPFSNIALGFILLLISAFVLSPFAVNNIYDYDGVLVDNLVLEGNETMPAELAGIGIGEKIIEMDGTEIVYISHFSEVLNNHSPGDMINVITNESNYNVTLTETPGNSEHAYIGIFAGQSKEIRESFHDQFGIFVSPIIWIIGLIYWLYLLNLGIGLFNLVPLGPVDGGLMVHAVLLDKCKTKKNADMIFKIITTFFLFLVGISIVSSFF